MTEATLSSGRLARKPLTYFKMAADYILMMIVDSFQQLQLIVKIDETALKMLQLKLVLYYADLLILYSVNILFL